jgi:hypothetical protein
MTGSRDLRRWLAAGLLGAMIAAGTGVAFAQSDDLQPPAAFAGIADPAARSVALFEEAGKVLQHPRCVNCHPAGDVPLQNDEMRLHQPPVVRGDGGIGVTGMRCFTCHQQQNYDAVGVPGHPLWHLAPLEMAWQGRSLGQICEQLKDPERNGGKTLAELHEHMGRIRWSAGAGIPTPAAARCRARRSCSAS